MNDTNKDKLSSTLCTSCNSKTIRVFKKNKNGIWYTKINEKTVYVDEDDIPRIQNLNLQITFKDSMYPYVFIRIDANSTMALHRYLIGVTDKDNVVDHINHNTLDNRKCNLRIATVSENTTNSKIPKSNNIGFKNISLCDRVNHPWFVQYRYQGRRITKRFSKFIEAYSYLKESETYNSEFLYDILNDENIQLRYSGVDTDEFINGEFIGETVFTQYCTHHCHHCHNPSTWSSDGGMVFDKNVFDNIIGYFYKSPYAKRLSISGGEPMDNLALTNLIAAEFKYLFPDKKLWIYTGYTYEFLKEKIEYKVILELCDYLVDGEFIEEFKDLTLAFRGSSNQRIIDIQSTNKKGDIVLWKNVS